MIITRVNKKILPVNIRVIRKIQSIRMHRFVFNIDQFNNLYRIKSKFTIFQLSLRFRLFSRILFLSIVYHFASIMKKTSITLFPRISKRGRERKQRWSGIGNRKFYERQRKKQKSVNYWPL